MEAVDRAFWIEVLIHLRFATLAVLTLASLWILQTHEGSTSYLLKRLVFAFTLISINVAGIVITVLILKVPYL